MFNINKFFFFVFVIIVVGILCLPVQVLAKEKEINTTTVDSSEAASDSFFDTLPQAILRCHVGGSLASVFHGERKYKSSENVILIDGNSKKMAVREVIESVGEDDNVNIEMFIEISNVTQDDITNFLVLKKTMRTSNAFVDLILKKTSDEGETVVKTNIDDTNSEPNATLFGKITKVSSATFNGKDYFLASGLMKLRLTERLEGLEFNNIDDSNEGHNTAILQCRFEKCPVVKTNLERLKEEFDIEIGEEDVLGESESSDESAFEE